MSIVAIEYAFIESLVAELPWFQRYYIGGANKAERLALERQNIKRNNSYKSILKSMGVEYPKNSTNSN